MKLGSAVNQVPLDSVNYNASSVFGAGANLGGGNFVVYNGMGSGVIVTGLNPIQPYYLRVIEYNGNNSTANYNISNVLNSFPVFLPVEWLSFTGEISNQNIELQWKTASEKNSYSFDIERSFDEENWEKIGEQLAAGNSSVQNTYSFIDENIFINTNTTVFYRLKQIDFDGQFSYSKIISFKPIAADLSNLVLYPNPLNTPSIHIDGINENQLFDVYVYDITGIEVLSFLNNEGTEKTIEINEHLKNGAYFFKVKQGNSEKTKLIIIE